MGGLTRTLEIRTSPHVLSGYSVDTIMFNVVLALLPAILGMGLGQRLRGHLSEARFRQVFFSSLLLLGLYIAGRTLLG